MDGQTAKEDANRQSARLAFGEGRHAGEIGLLIVEGGATISVQFFKPEKLTDEPIPPASRT
ncbi:hypothetical protein CDU00_05860 [Cronobacter sakazakii]|nr:hypothetical protein CDU00_05860 [Cronobacter sakazakii]PUY17111.1 hypothetical protein BTK72_12905 [Cronobacter sakazakii]